MKRRISMKSKILMAEDDNNLGFMLQDHLEDHGFEVDRALNGEIALEYFNSNSDYDICVFDVMMPKMDGFSLLTEIRKVNQDIPVIFLTAKSLKEDKIKGFRLGGDDYLTKPFSVDELLLRIEAILKRTKNGTSSNIPSQFTLGDFTFDYQRQILKTGLNEMKLTSKESDLLKLLCIKQNDVLDRSDALKKVWGDDSYYNARSMDVYMSKIRKYLKGDERIEILNVHGKGFKLLVNEY